MNRTLPLQPGVRLGPYEIQSAIDAGGMGDVYKARDTRLPRTVAIKILQEHLANDPQFRERFNRESDALAALNHPHICTLHDIGRQEIGSGQVDYIVMEHLDGETLAGRLGRGALPLSGALSIAIEVTDALAAAHRVGITHRDLKPGNVMLTKSGAKLLDFGLAKVEGQGIRALADDSTLTGIQSDLTTPGTILGTFGYMAPEQVEGRHIDARADIFAFGALLYEMLTGQRAFGGRTRASVIAAILDREPPALMSVRPQTPPALNRLVRRCLVKDPDERWQSAHDLREELKWIAAEAIEGKAAGSTAPPVRPDPRPPYAWIVAAVFLLATLALGTALLLRPAAPSLPLLRLDVNTPPTADPFSFALSPDGRQLAFVALDGGASKLWLRSLDQMAARPLEGTIGATYPFWAPSSRAIGFFADGKLKRLDLAGGTPQAIADAPSGRGGAWSSDDVILFAPNITTGLMRVAATGGTPTAVTRRADGEGSHRFPAFLPDGQRFLFFSAQSRPDVQGVYLGSLDASGTRRLAAADSAAEYGSPGYLLMVRQGVLVAERFDVAGGTLMGDPVPVASAIGLVGGGRGAFSASATGLLAHRSGVPGAQQLTWIDRGGKTTATVGSPDTPGAFSFPELAASGSRVAVEGVVDGNADVWVIDAVRALPNRFTVSPASEGAPVWSSDGSRIVFRSNRNGFFDLFEKPASGAREEQLLLQTSTDKFPADLSPDGGVLLYVNQAATTASDLWALPRDDTREPFPVVQTSFSEDEGQFSPDGRWIVYRSNESGRLEIYARPFPGPGGTQRISTQGGSHPRWSRRGNELFYIALDNQLMSVPIRQSSDAKTLDVGVPRALFPTRLAGASSLPKQQFAVAADGQRFLMIVADDRSAPPITIVQNWMAGTRE